MVKEKNKSTSSSKAMYEEPFVEIIKFGVEDIVTTSGNKDPNQGEWDAQNEFNIRERTDN